MSTATTDAAATGGRVAAPSGSPGAACPKYATAHPLAAVLSAQAAMADLTGDMWLDAARIAAMQQLVHHQP